MQQYHEVGMRLGWQAVVGNTVLYILRAMMRRVDGEKSILGTELVEPK
jgi:hypothetical protein